MIIPVRCFTCGSVISDRWEAYVRLEKQLIDSREPSEIASLEELSRSREAPKLTPNVPRAEILDKLAVKRICCRRHFLSNIDLMDEI